MELKKMLVTQAIKLAEEQADSMKEQFLAYVKSDEFETMIAEGMDRAINIPFVREDKEAPIFRDVADLVQKVFIKIITGVK